MLGTSSIKEQCLHFMPHSCKSIPYVAGIITFLVLGILATTGCFNMMGVNNAAYFSYAMYGAAALLSLLAIIHRACCWSEKSPGHSGGEPRISEKEKKTIEPLNNDEWIELGNILSRKAGDIPNTLVTKHFGNREGCKNYISGLINEKSFRNNQELKDKAEEDEAHNMAVILITDALNEVYGKRK